MLDQIQTEGKTVYKAKFLDVDRQCDKRTDGRTELP